MRRALVLTTESARHPFRASLPPIVLRRAGEIESTVPWRKRLAQTSSDIRMFGMTYIAGFAGTLTFFA